MRNKVMCKIKRSVLLMLVFGAMTTSVLAKDLGSFGDVYPIIEPDIRQVIQQRLEAMKASGQLQALQKDLQARARKKLDRPEDVTHLPTVKHNRSYLVDPSITTTAPIQDEHGKVLVPKGKTFNPLTWIRLRTPLAFFNGDDQKQVAWAHHIAQTMPLAKLILVHGSIKHAALNFPIPIYFDQFGKLTTRFKLKAVPALVTQQGQMLRIQEVVP